MEQTSPSTPRNMRKEGEDGLINGACLMVILIYGITSHVPPLELLGIMQGPETLLGTLLTWGLLCSNIYVFVGGYFVLQWIAAGPDGPETMQKIFAGRLIKILGAISLVWLSMFWVIQHGL